MVLAHEIDKGERTKDIKTSQGVTFSSMLLSPETLQGLQSSGFFKPSPIQLHAIPLGKCGFDLILEAKSGTGKTAVFSIIALEQLDLQKGLQTIILAPTREIAAQVCDVIKQIGCSYEGLQVEVVMGGLPVQDDIAKFKKKVHILVGSPGRLRQLVQEKYVNVSSVRLLVLDEADRLVDKSFVDDINYIFFSLPRQKQVIMSSATYPEKTKEAIHKYLQGAQHICPEADSILIGIEQRVTYVKHNVNIVKQTMFRFEELLNILSSKPFKQCLIFCNYQTRVAEVGKMLNKAKWPVEQLYGQQDQTDRLEALKTLQDYGCRILVSTDLAARGIDASNVDLVINFEPPFEWQTYLHRIGRAGRFGSYGMAVSILSEGREENKFKTMLAEIRGSINYKKFWDDKMFVAEVNSNMPKPTPPESNSPKSENHKEQEVFQKLWDILASPSKTDSKEIESFETLCKSFDETKESEIESFSDLLHSFNIYEPNNNANEESIYQCLSQPDIPTAEYYSIINNTKTDMTEKDIILDENQCQRKERQVESNATDINNEKLNLKFEDLIIKSKFALATAEENVARMNHLENGDNANSDYEFKDHELPDTPHTAQLPTALGSSKDRMSIYSKIVLATAQRNIERKDNLQNGNNANNDYESESPELTDALCATGLPTAFRSSRGRKSNIKITTAQGNIERKDNLQNGNNANYDYEFQNPKLTDELRAAGLPTAFGRSKGRKSNIKIICKPNNKKSEENSLSRTLSSKIYNSNIDNNNTSEIKAYSGITVGHKHSFRNGPVNEYSRALKFNEPNSSNYFQNKTELDCFNKASQSKYNLHTLINPIQGSDNDKYIVKDRACHNFSQYHRCNQSKNTPGPVNQSFSSIKALHGWTTVNEKQDNMHKPSDPSSPKCSIETSDEDSDSSSDEPALSPEYVNWYKTLKYRTLQVQLTVYLDEMSKL